MAAALDPVTQQVVQGALKGIAEQMVIMVMRTAYSPLIREGGDCTAVLFDRNGQTIAQGLTLALHLGAMPAALDVVRDKYRDDVDPGDVFVLNDPDEGGMHLPDVFLFMPIFHGSELIGWSGTIAHQMDMGGRSPGGLAADSVDIFQEGLQLPCLRFVEGGRENETLTAILGKNIRYPTETLGDLRAQVGACHVGAEGLRALANEHGPRRLQQYIDSILDTTEQLMRSKIRDLPDGVFRYQDFLGDHGFGDEPIEIAVSVTIEGDRVTADFGGSSPQVPAALNGTLSAAQAAVYAALQSVVGLPDLLDNAGAWRPITVEAPEGTVVNPRRPAARGARGVTLSREFDAVMGALQQALPDLVPAPGADNDVMTFTVAEDGGSESSFIEAVTGGWGGGPHGDGVEGVSPLFKNVSNQPVEFVESMFPLRIEEYALVPDSGGAGTFTGALAVRRTYRFLAERGAVRVRSDRRRGLGPRGVAGGEAGSPTSTVVNPGTEGSISLPGLARHELRRGDVVSHTTSGGGAYGDPRDRDVDRVLDDVQDEKVSVRRAREVFGVDVDLARGVAVR